jgi:Ni/Co efflux regulator RcnB
MSKPLLATRYAGVLLLGALIAMPALAERPDKAGKGHGNTPKAERHEKYDRHDHDHDYHSDGNLDVHVDVFFGDRQRILIRDYYETEFRGDHCPPGLAKKGNGCMPPGQAKKWRRGYPLPRDVVYYDLPPRLVVELGPPPIGHKYVRVAADILLIAVGTGMVIDAIDDLSRL